MKTTKKWSKTLLVGVAAKAMLVAALTFGLVLAGCDDGGGGGTTYTVTYAVGTGAGGTAPASQMVASGATVTLPGQGSMTAPSGDSFLGWEAGGTAYSAGASYTVTGNVTFTAQWGADPDLAKVQGTWLADGPGYPASGVQVEYVFTGNTVRYGRLVNGAVDAAGYITGGTFVINSSVTPHTLVGTFPAPNTGYGFNYTYVLTNGDQSLEMYNAGTLIRTCIKQP